MGQQCVSEQRQGWQEGQHASIADGQEQGSAAY